MPGPGVCGGDHDAAKQFRRVGRKRKIDSIQAIFVRYNPLYLVIIVEN
jgi:hypothetical protein